MSVDYRAIYGYGFCVSNKEVATLSDKLYDEFVDSIFTHRTDYIYGETEYFFGLSLCSAEPGYMFALPAVDNYAHEDFMQMMKEFKHFFPQRKTSEIKHYLINQVW